MYHFDPVAQEALPDHIKAKMKADRDKAKLEAYHKQCPCQNSHNDSCYDDNCPCDRDCEYMKSFNLKRSESWNVEKFGTAEMNILLSQKMKNDISEPQSG